MVVKRPFFQGYVLLPFASHFELSCGHPYHLEAENPKF